MIWFCRCTSSTTCMPYLSRSTICRAAPPLMCFKHHVQHNLVLVLQMVHLCQMLSVGQHGSAKKWTPGLVYSAPADAVVSAWPCLQHSRNLGSAIWRITSHSVATQLDPTTDVFARRMVMPRPRCNGHGCRAATVLAHWTL